ncbi:MAG: UbiA family prenyltransferase [Candidatus Edwardsbacteria bacterium]|nr:UbiA family prenyltransferase [Candidatus Edwardsbacteria bacterium]
MVCAWVTSLIGLICLARIGCVTLSLGLFTTTFLFLYSWWLKDCFGLLANIALSACLALLPVGAAFHGQTKPQIGFIFGTVFGLMLCREVVKDIQDRSGDASTGRRTLATAKHELLAVVMVVVGAIIAISCSLPFASELPLGVIVLVLDLIVGGTVLSWLSRRLTLAGLKHFLKVTMFGFAVVFLVMGVRYV